MKLETERLQIYPISNDDIKQLIQHEKTPELKQAYSEMLQGCIQNPENRIWYTVWFISLKDNPDTIVGDLSFKGLNMDGMVEIGYGLREGYCGNGYMTEAVRRICEWAVSQTSVSRIESETASDNIASQKVLLNAGFIPTDKFGEEGPRFLYRTYNHV